LSFLKIEKDLGNLKIQERLGVASTLLTEVIHKKVGRITLAKPRAHSERWSQRWSYSVRKEIPYV